MRSAIRLWCLAAFDLLQKLAYAALVLYGGYRIVQDLRVLLGGAS